MKAIWSFICALLVLACGVHSAGQGCAALGGNENAACPQCRQAGIEFAFPVVYNLQTGVTSGWYANSGGPVELSVAAGNNTDGGRVVVLLDFSVMILRKDTKEILDTIDQRYWPGTTGNYFGEAYVQYDKLSNRFFYTAPVAANCFQAVTVLSNNSVTTALCSGTATFGPATYNVTAPIVLAQPLDGCTLLSNAIFVAGKIALMQTDGTCSFTTMASNAQAAGAVGVIIIDNKNELVFTITGTDPSIVIPVLLISLIDGQEVIANLPATATLNSAGANTFIQAMTITVSKSSAPSNFTTDWYVFTYARANWSGVLYLDDLKSQPLPGALIVTSESYLVSQGSYGETQIVSFDMKSLINGVGTVPIWSTFMPSIPPGSNYLFAAHNYPPLTGPNPYVFFVALGAPTATPYCANMVSSVLVWWADSQRMYNKYTPTELAINPLCYNNNQGSRQPPPLIPFGFAYRASINSAIVSGTSLYLAVSNTVSSVHTTVRWIRIGMANFWSNEELTVLDDGDVNPTPLLDLTSPRIEATKHDDVVLFFNSNGPEQFIDGTFVVHLHGDPKDSMRYLANGPAPNTMINWARGNNTFFNQYRHGKGWRFQGSALDPDGETIYMYTAFADPRGPVDSYGRSVSFTTALGGVKIRALDCSSCLPAIPTIPVVTPVNYVFEAAWALGNPWNRSNSIP